MTMKKNTVVILLLFFIGISEAQNNWEYFAQPAQIFRRSLTKGTVMIDYSQLVPTDKDYQEISILLSWITGAIGGSGSCLITLENVDGSPYKHYSRVPTYSANQDSWNT